MCKGDDVRKWHIRERKQWLIFTRRGINIDDYPAIKKHLNYFREQLNPRPLDWGKKHPDDNWPGRKPGPYQWYEIQDSIAYHDIFNSPKIIYPEIAKESRFAFDSSGIYPQKTTFNIPTKDLFLLGVLNSKTAWNYLKKVCSVLGDEDKGGRLTLQETFVETLPIPRASDKDKKTIEKLVQKCLDVEGRNCDKWEKEIDEIVTKLYGLEE
jgi:hypothetical protein